MTKRQKEGEHSLHWVVRRQKLGIASVSYYITEATTASEHRQRLVVVA